MTRSKLFSSMCVAAVCIVGSLAGATHSGGQGEQSIENSLAVQRAVMQARDHLLSAEAKKAVEVLEANLSRINGDRKYLALLRDSYRSHIKDLALANQQAAVDVYQKRLKILEDSENAPQSVAIPAIAALAKPVESAPRVEEAPIAKIELVAPSRTDPFAAANELKSMPVTVPAQISPGKALLAKADQEFLQKHYAMAKHLYEEANLADKSVLADEGRNRWAYCQLAIVVEQVNQSGEKPCDWAKLEAEVKNAIAVAPQLANTGNNVLGDIAKRRGSPTTFRGAMPTVAVKHLPKRPDGWLLAETANFRVFHGQSSDYAEKAAEIAEFTRSQMTRKWFGKEGEDWSPKCDIYLYPTGTQYSQRTGENGASPGHSKIELDRKTGRVVVREVHLRCDNPSLLEAILPHETTHVVLGGQFGNHHVPRWVDEGVAVLTEPNEKIQQHRANLMKSLHSQQLIPLSSLMQMDNYPAPAQISVFYAQSVALVDFLAKQKGPTVVTQFVRDALREGYEPSLRKHYGIQTIAELQDRFTERLISESSGAAPTYSGR